MNLFSYKWFLELPFPFSWPYFFVQTEPSAPETEKGAGFSSDEEGGPSSGTAGRDVAISWPQNRQVEKQKEEQTTKKSKREKKGEAAQLFPFEKLWSKQAFLYHFQMQEHSCHIKCILCQLRSSSVHLCFWAIRDQPNSASGMSFAVVDD